MVLPFFISEKIIDDRILSVYSVLQPFTHLNSDRIAVLMTRSAFLDSTHCTQLIICGSIDTAKLTREFRIHSFL